MVRIQVAAAQLAVPHGRTREDCDCAFAVTGKLQQFQSVGGDWKSSEVARGDGLGFFKELPIYDPRRACPAAARVIFRARGILRWLRFCAGPSRSLLGQSMAS